LRLLLLRHAKSDWSTDADDHDRPLSARGRKAAPEMGHYMRAEGYVPAVVLCSTATRTRETLDLLLSAWKDEPSVNYDRALYLAEWPQLVVAVKKAPASASPLLLIGHNPGLEQMAVGLCRAPDGAAERDRLKRLASKFPTAALAVLDFEITSWGDLHPGSGELVAFTRPKDVAGEKG